MQDVSVGAWLQWRHGGCKMLADVDAAPRIRGRRTRQQNTLNATPAVICDRCAVALYGARLEFVAYPATADKVPVYQRLDLVTFSDITIHLIEQKTIRPFNIICTPSPI